MAIFGKLWHSVDTGHTVSRRTSALRKRVRCRPLLEPLENRALLATLNWHPSGISASLDSENENPLFDPYLKDSTKLTGNGERSVHIQGPSGAVNCSATVSSTYGANQIDVHYTDQLHTTMRAHTTAYGYSTGGPTVVIEPSPGEHVGDPVTVTMHITYKYTSNIPPEKLFGTQVFATCKGADYMFFEFGDGMSSRPYEPPPSNGEWTHSIQIKIGDEFSFEAGTGIYAWDSGSLSDDYVLDFSSDFAVHVSLDTHPQPQPHAQIQINDTPDPNDNITLYNPPPNQAYTQTIPAKITNTGNAEGTFNLSVDPPGAATLSQTAVTLGAGASTEITITPTADSSAPNDVHIVAMQGTTKVGEDDMTIVSVTMRDDQNNLTQHIRNVDTPASMPDRIPPKVNTPVNITVTPNLAGGQSVTLVINGQSADNGSVTIDGAATKNVTTKGVVNLSGTAQTAPGGHAGNLILAVRVHGQDTVQSQGFSVSAIPVKFEEEFPAAGNLPYPGWIMANYKWQSDSGDPRDLDQVWVGEVVHFSDGGDHITRIPWGSPWRGNNLEPTVLPLDPAGNPRKNGANSRFLEGDVISPPGGVRQEDVKNLEDARTKLPTAGPADHYYIFQFYKFHDYRADNRPVPDRESALGGAFINFDPWADGMFALYIADYYVEKVGGQWQFRLTRYNNADPDAVTTAQDYLSPVFRASSLISTEVLPQDEVTARVNREIGAHPSRPRSSPLRQPDPASRGPDFLGESSWRDISRPSVQWWRSARSLGFPHICSWVNSVLKTTGRRFPGGRAAAGSA